MSYSSEVLADTPWAFWQETETSGTTLADSSGSSRTATLGGTYSLNQTGPSVGVKAIAYPSGGGGNALGPTVATSPATLECWFKIDTLDTTYGHWLMGCANGIGGGITDKNLYVGNDGKLYLITYDPSGNKYTASAGSITFGVWHHIVASVGAAGSKIRLDKTTVASNTGITTSYAGTAMNVIHHGGGGSAGGGPVNGAGAATLAMPAFYTKQLTDARADAHYDAMFASAGATGTLAGNIGAVTGSLTGTSTLPSASGTLAGNVGAITGALSGTATAPSATGTLSGTIGAVTGSIAGTGSAPATQAGVLTGTIGPITGELTADSPSGVTDTANYANGSCRLGSGEDHSLYPVKPLPAHLAVTKHRIMAQQMPAPVLVDGKPT